MTKVIDFFEDAQPLTNEEKKVLADFWGTPAHKILCRSMKHLKLLAIGDLITDGGNGDIYRGAIAAYDNLITEIGLAKKKSEEANSAFAKGGK